MNYHFKNLRDLNYDCPVMGWEDPASGLLNVDDMETGKILSEAEHPTLGHIARVRFPHQREWCPETYRDNWFCRDEPGKNEIWLLSIVYYERSDIPEDIRDLMDECDELTPL